MLDPNSLDLSAGNYIRGIPLGAPGAENHNFICSTTFAQLKSITRDPQDLQVRTKAQAVSEDLEHDIAIHELVQRALKDTKKANVPKYRTYIEELVSGRRQGVLPPMHLWSDQPLQVVAQGAQTYLLVPNDTYLLAIDGETQLAAHYSLQSNASGAEAEVKKTHKQYPLAAVIHHGIPVFAARQYFHDLNLLAVRLNTSLGLSMDTHDPLIKIVETIETEVPFLTARVDKSSRQLPKASHKVLTLQTLRQMVINVAKGMGGIQYGARPVPIGDLNLDDVHDVAREWLNTIFNTFGSQVADREKFIISTPSVLSAMAAMGNKILTADPVDRTQIRDQLLASLQHVDWRKGEHWVGIAGKISERGKFVVGGTKEVSYAIYNVLSNPENDGYRRVRGETLALVGV